jgi:hypothetical protein
MESLTLRALTRELEAFVRRPLAEVGPSSAGTGLRLALGTAGAALDVLPDGPPPALRWTPPAETAPPAGKGGAPGRRRSGDLPAGDGWVAEAAWHLEQRARGGTLDAVLTRGLERVVALVFSRKDRYGDAITTSLVVELFGAFVNVIVVEGAPEGGRILACRHDESKRGARARIRRGQPWRWPESDRTDLLLHGRPALVAALSSAAPPDAADPNAWSAVLARVAAGLGPRPAARLVADVAAPLSADSLATAFEERLAAVESNPRVELDRAGVLAGSGSSAASNAGTASPPGSSGAAPRPIAPDPRRDVLLARLEARARTARKRLEHLEAERDRHPDAETPRRMAETLLAAADRVPRGADRVTLAAADDSGEMTIALDPARSAIENADRYFKEARKARQSAERLPREIERAAREAERWHTLAERCRAAAPGDRAALESLEQDAFGRPRGGGAGGRGASSSGGGAASRGGPGAGGPPRGDNLSSAMRPRRYDLPGGWVALVGKSQVANDFLTHRLAAPHDLWFHAHGCAGSHVVLKAPDRKIEPDRRVIEAAAALAALHSKARHAGRVPVIYAEKRYVRKPRGSKPGLAAVTNEKSVMVKPAEPSPPVEDE